jgi:flagellar hook protein FlgE
MPSFSIPLSGLSSNSQALSVIANNLANLNTIGYKAMRPVFRDLFYQQVGSSGSGNPLQVGAGVTMSSISTVASQGSIESTGVPTDVAIQGEGYFVVQKGGVMYYTRAGNFTVNADGTLETADGAQVLGYPAANGTVSTNQALKALAVSSGQINPPNATTNIQLGMNLDASAAVGDKFSTSIAVYDSLGSSHILTVNFTKGAANSWDYDVTIPGQDVGAKAPVSITTGTLTFDGQGNLTAGTKDITGMQVSSLADGASDMSFTWHLFDSAGKGLVTQVAAPSAVANTRQDGFSSGTLQSFDIGSDGIIEGTFSNGQTTALGQIAVATFANLQGLSRIGSNNFLDTLASGAPNVGVPGTGGRGTLAGSALEDSNVDIAQEFSQLIISQRAFQANSRAVTTFDQVAQDAINLKQ